MEAYFMPFTNNLSLLTQNWKLQSSDDSQNSLKNFSKQLSFQILQYVRTL